MDDVNQSIESNVDNIYILHDDNVMTDLLITEGEGARLHLRIEPFITETEILWESSDPNVLTITSNPTENSIYIHGLRSGYATISVRVNNSVETCIIYVSENITHAPLPAAHNPLSDTIQNTTNHVHLTATWNEGQYRGKSTVFERVEGSSQWTMESRSGGVSPIDAGISYENGVLTIIVSGQSPWYYYFQEDGTGYMIHPDGTTRENFTWSANNATNSDFILPFSSTRLLTDDDLKDLSKENLRIARNEIYARYGYQFSSQDLQNYFNNKSWYTNLTKLPNGTAPSFSTLEYSNLTLILEYEARG